jgi:hypothetical protein
MATKQVWMGDPEMELLVGEWWTQEMDLHNDGTNEQNVESANAELEKRGYTTRVLACRAAEQQWFGYLHMPDECYEWLVEREEQ